MLVRVLGLAALTFLGFTIAGAQEKPAQVPATPPLLAPPVKPLADSYLQWPLPESARQYLRIDGRHLHAYVEELAAISTGAAKPATSGGAASPAAAHAQTQNMLAAKFKSLGLSDVRLEEYPLPPAWFPTSWQVARPRPKGLSC